MQFSVIRSYCATRFRDVGLQIVTDADWKNYCNSVYGDMLSRCTWFPWNENTITSVLNSGVRSVPLPLDAWQVLSVYDSTDGFPLVPLQGRTQVYQEYPQQTEVGQPMHYRIFNNNLQVYPLPQVNTSFIIEYIKRPADLVNDADLPVFPDQYHDSIVAGAVAMAYRDDGNPQMAAAFDKEYEDSITQMVRDLMQPRQESYYQPTDYGL